jgi:hypothetical protein
MKQTTIVGILLIVFGIGIFSSAFLPSQAEAKWVNLSFGSLLALAGIALTIPWKRKRLTRAEMPMTESPKDLRPWNDFAESSNL